ncbi:MAG: DUF559 domain-containing protein [Bacteroidota bacterium]
MTLQQAQNYTAHLRRRPTAAEDFFWRRCRNQKIGGLDFKRHHIFDLLEEDETPIHFVVGFYCPKQQLVIELGGPGSLLSAANYQKRLEQLRDQLDIRVLTFSDKQVLEKWGEVEQEILAEV